MSNICVLAFSGGLDTSFCAQYIKRELKMTVHSVIVNTGGFSQSELDDVEKKARTLGVAHHTAIDETQSYYNEGVRYLIYGNVLKNGNYPLSVSSERFFQARAIANYARQIGATAIAHGSTGAGNDQVRFDMIFQTLYPGVRIITPVRDLKLSRQEEVDYLVKSGFDMSWEKARYSINVGLWGTSVGGVETLTSHQPLPQEAWPTQVTEYESKRISIAFERGQPVALNGVHDDPVAIIRAVQEVAGPFGIGRDMHVGDTIIGIKGRVGFEAAAPTILVKTHHLLEKHCLTKWQLQLKQQLSDWYGMLFHEGQYLDPAMRDIEQFLTSSQERVTGEVKVHLQPYRFSLEGVSSPYDLMQSSFANYGEDNKAWTAADAKGFIKIFGNNVKLWAAAKNDAI